MPEFAIARFCFSSTPKCLRDKTAHTSASISQCRSFMPSWQPSIAPRNCKPRPDTPPPCPRCHQVEHGAGQAWARLRPPRLHGIARSIVPMRVGACQMARTGDHRRCCRCGTDTFPASHSDSALLLNHLAARALGSLAPSSLQHLSTIRAAVPRNWQMP